AGVATAGHSKVMQDHVPKADAYSVKKLREAGAIVMGKLATHKFALGGPSFDLPWPPARNPWDTTRFTSGSSGGTGAAGGAGAGLGGTRRGHRGAGGPARGATARARAAGGRRWPASRGSSRPTASSAGPEFCRWRSRWIMPGR